MQDYGNVLHTDNSEELAVTFLYNSWGPLNVSRGVGIFAKIWSADVQYEILYTQN